MSDNKCQQCDAARREEWKILVIMAIGMLATYCVGMVTTIGHCSGHN